MRLQFRKTEVRFSSDSVFVCGFISVQKKMFLLYI